MLPASITVTILSVLTEKKAEYETSDGEYNAEIADLVEAIEWIQNHADQDTIYIGKVMEEGVDYITTTRIGLTKEATKQACLQGVREYDLVPARILHRLEWDEDRADQGNWIFLIQEKDLQKALTEQPAADTQ